MDAVHLHQQAQQRTLTLHAAGVPTQRAAGAPDRIDLVNKDDAGALLARGVEQAVDTRGSDACGKVVMVAAAAMTGEVRHKGTRAVGPGF